MQEVERLLADSSGLPRRDPLYGSASNLRRRSPTPVPISEDLATRIEGSAWDRKCFYPTPLKSKESDERYHSDGLVEELVRPAVERVNKTFTVVRSNELPTTSILSGIDEHIVKARLLIGDLSYGCGNVFQELGGRRLTGRPYVLICREGDEVPSNFTGERIVFFSTHFRKYRLELDERIAELALNIEWALSAAGFRHQPIRAQFPDFLDYYREV